VKRIEAIVRPFRLEEVQQSLHELGLQGMTVTEALGAGHGCGSPHVHHGITYSEAFMPRVKVEIVVTDDQVGPVLDTIVGAAHTGRVGDGQVSVTTVDEVLRIRTGERGGGAL
jgi:nitrogen regulatory protein P-II 1